MIERLQSQQEADGDRRSDSWIVDQALREYIINENRDISFEECAGSDQIIGYVSPETKQWVKQFCKSIGRSESWVTAKAIAVFLRERGL
jgi:predicted transcriptional regulator